EMPRLLLCHKQLRSVLPNPTLGHCPRPSGHLTFTLASTFAFTFTFTFASFFAFAMPLGILVGLPTLVCDIRDIHIPHIGILDVLSKANLPAGFHRREWLCGKEPDCK
ncbi:hypothetical protein AB0M45_31675, partial [Nocardia sp. NPDC051787]|uniref:hypothetical protein n=1 Tax=Nocardia sp. NPDC051787 TaxID=3155415 RepID=UPI00341B96A5